MTLQHVLASCSNSSIADNTLSNVKRWVINFSGNTLPCEIQSITSGNLLLLRREVKIVNSLLVISFWTRAPGVSENPNNPMRAAGDAIWIASFKIDGWQAASIINVGSSFRISVNSVSLLLIMTVMLPTY